MRASSASRSEGSGEVNETGSPVAGWSKRNAEAWRNGRRSSDSGQRPAPAVDVVADHRVADGGQVDPDLMGPTGLERDGEEGCRMGRREAPLDPVAGPGRVRPCRWTAIRVGTRADRPMGASTTPLSRSTSRRAPVPGRSARPGDRPSWATRATRAGSVRATTISPEVPRSRRCTMPGRSASAPPWPATPSGRGTGPRSPCTSVPVRCPAPGWTTRPAGLSTTTTWSSAKTTS